MPDQDGPWKLITGGLLWDGRGGEPIRDAAMLIQGTKLRQVGSANQVLPPDGVEPERHDFAGKTILPGLIDMHTHLNVPTDVSTYEEVAGLSDEFLVLQSAHHAKRMLEAGITTAGDCGGKGQTTFVVREAIRRGLATGPRLLLSGRAITVTRGHFWMFGGEADGIDGVRRAVRRLVHEGADFIKVMGTGGSTAGTNLATPEWSSEELRTIVDEAHRFGKPVAVHNRGTKAVINSLEAGVDILVHCDFFEEDGSWSFSEDLAKRIAEAGVWLNPTLNVIRTFVWHFRELEKARPLTPEERDQLRWREDLYRRRCEVTGQMFEQGVKIAAGSDPGTNLHNAHEHYYRELDSLMEAGLTWADAIAAATSNVASALGVGDTVGALEPDKNADVLVVDGDPRQDTAALGRVVAVFLGGERVH